MSNLFLALRNIFRNKRRTLITFSAIVSGISAIVVFGGFIEFSFQGLKESTIRTQLGHMQIHKEGYNEHGNANPGDYLIEDPERVEQELEEIPELETVTRRLTFSGLASTGETTVNANVIGVMPGREGGFNDFETITRGFQLGPDDTEGGILGQELAQSLGVEPGDYVMIMTTTYDGVINAIEFEVIGIARTGSEDFDSVFIKLPISLVQQAVNTTAVDSLLVLFDPEADEAATRVAVTDAMDRTGLDLEYRWWEDIAGFYQNVVALYNGIFGVFSVIISLVVLFSIANTLSMSVFERIREIGTLRAIGSPRLAIMRMFLAEGLAIGILGGILGIGIGLLIAVIINVLGGIPMPPPPGQTVGFDALIVIDPTVLVYAFALTVGASVISSLYPAIVASRLRIVEALQHS